MLGKEEKKIIAEKIQTEITKKSTKEQGRSASNL